MKNLNLKLAFYFCCILLQSCKKSNEVVIKPETNPITNTYKDSISFSISGTKYVFTERRSFGSGNYAIDVKKFDERIAGGKLASETGGYYWYGVPDSTLYAAHYQLNSKDAGQNFEIIFSKKYKDSELLWKAGLLYPKSHDELFKIGEQGFAADLNKENTMDGVAISLYDNAFGGPLISMIPGFSMLVRSNLKKDIQDNSDFDILKVEKSSNGQYLIEAKFRVNLFDKDGKLFKLENGFLRLNAPLFYNL